MDAAELKAELLRLLAEDADFKVAVREAIWGKATLREPLAGEMAPDATAPLVDEQGVPVRLRGGPDWLRRGNYLAR